MTNLWQQIQAELITDLYELTMANSYWREGMAGEATFSLFIRKYPPQRAYFVAAGIEHLLQILTDFRFSVASLAYLQGTKQFPAEFLDYLSKLRFTGTVRALPEGRIFFANEPVVEITGPIIEAQLVETVVMNTVHLETLLATKAARCMHAAQGRGLVEFGLRRTHGVDAGLKAARASYLTGFRGTSNVLAGMVYGIPIYGTMAHSYVSSFHHEIDAFRAYARSFPENTVLLVDTYDTVRGAEKAVTVARQLAAQGHKLRAVRLDSGDLVELSQAVRALFRREGVAEVGIMISGNLDEYRLEELLARGTEFDLAGIGTHLSVSADAPYLDMAYKLVEYEGRPILKLSPGKQTWVGKKQIQRYYDSSHRMREDVLGLESEQDSEATPLLELRIHDGQLVRPLETLPAIRQRFRREWETVPQEYRALRPKHQYPVKISSPLQNLQETISRQRAREEVGPS
jgi:nicotinate phosphoribosyltransferase